MMPRVENQNLSGAQSNTMEVKPPTTGSVKPTLSREEIRLTWMMLIIFLLFVVSFKFYL